MTIYCGDTPSFRLYCGSQSIGQIYCGETLAYGEEPSTDLTTIALTLLTRTGATPVGRQGAGMVGDEESGVVYGGRGTVQLNDAFSYTVSTSNVAVTALTVTGTITPRAFLAMVGSNTEGLIVGGQLTSGVKSAFIYRYTVSGGNFTTLALTRTGFTAYEGRRWPGLVGDGDNALIFGGDGATSGGLNDFVLAVRTGGNIALTNLTVTGTIQAMWQHAMAGDTTEGIIFGGWTTGPVRSNAFYRFTRSGNTVTVTALTVAGDAITARSGASLAGSATEGLIFGGTDSTGRVDDFYFFKVNTATNTVNLTLLTETGYTVSGRQQAGFVNMAGDIENGMIFGGRGSGATFLNDFIKYEAS